MKRPKATNDKCFMYFIIFPLINNSV